MNPVADEMRAILEGDEELAHYGMPRRSGRYPWGSGEDPYQHGSRDLLGRIEELKKSGWSETPENIKKEFGLNTTQYRIEKALAKDERRMYDVARAKSLRADGKGYTEIGRIMGIRESSVRSLLDDKSDARMKEAINTANFLKKRMIECKADGGMIDVGTGVERELNISKEKLGQALYLLQREGYKVYTGGIPQATNPGQQTNQKVLCPPGTPHKDIYDYSRIHTVKEYISRDGGETYEKKFHYPESLDSKRLKVLLADDIGTDGRPSKEKDGIIELRRGVPDLSLGESRYSQVRILVDGTHYLKGMAVYSDNMPDGVDVVFNTSKNDMSKALKEIKKDPDNPFGSLIKDAEQGGQYWYDPKTGERVSASTPNAKLGLINKRADEGDWDEWANALPSQFLAKQSRTMIKKQLDLAKADKNEEYEDICSVNNPTIKKHLLGKFADECDSAAVHLKAAALPGQKYHAIIPINSLKDDEVYAPNYEDGTKLALIRYPHGGTFEIPVLTVNNKHAPAQKLLGTKVIDAVGINAKVAEQLSGADFDGDTVMCIPTHDKGGKVKISHTDKLKGLEGFDNKALYQYDTKTKDADGTEHYYRNGKEFKIMKNTGTQMGIISNLITDMTIQGADPDELARAVRHSMVVIDAEKHKLDYKQSELDNNIAGLKKLYQPKYDEDGNQIGAGGAYTILSRAKGEETVYKRQGNPKINTKTLSNGKPNPDYDPSRPEGSLVYKTADDLYYPIRKYNRATGQYTLKTTDGKKITYDAGDKEAVERYTPIQKIDPKTGEVSFTNKAGDISYAWDVRTQPSTKMAETDDAYTLVSDVRHPTELLYADYANSMKALANEARKEMLATGKVEYSAAAKKTYQTEVDSLMSKLNNALLNTTKERAAQRKANAEVQAKTKANPDMKKSDIKKASQQALSKYRTEVGSVSRRERNIDITDREWEAIQAGAISETKLIQILNNADIDKLRERATPKTKLTLSPAKIARIKAMSGSNYTIEQIAKKYGISTSTVSKYLKGAN